MVINRFIPTLLSIVACMLLPYTANAFKTDVLPENASNDSVWKDSFLDEVVITGTRTPKLLKDTPIQTIVITSKDIQKVDATNIQDLLQQELPNVEFSYAQNQQVHLNFAGFCGQGVLFLVDGERMAGESMDDIDFTRLNMENVERIEIVKGAASALYGSNAGGGVINIITKNAGKKWAFNVNGRVAKHNEQRYGATVEHNGALLSNMLSFSFSNKDNYDVKSANDPVTRVISTIYGDKVISLKDQIVLKTYDNLRFTGRAGYFFRETVRTPEQPERYRDFSGGIRMNWDISSNDAMELAYSFDQYDKSDYQRISHLDIRDYSNVQNSLRALYCHKYAGGDLISVGADLLHDYLFNVNLEGKVRKQDSFDVFAQYDWNIDKRWELVGAVRYDYFSDNSNSQLTPKLSARYKATDNVNVRFGYGMGFRAPALKEKYYNFLMSGIWYIEGNDKLKAELAHNFNVAIEYTEGRYNLTATAYYNKVKDKIATAAPYFKSLSDKLPYLPYTNLNDYSVYGGEVTAQAKWSNGIGAKMTYAYTKEQLPKDGEGNSINNQYIPAREHSLSLRMDYEHEFSKAYRLMASINGRFMSGVENLEFKNYYDISEGTVSVKYPPYSIWKLSLTQHFGDHIRVTAALDNVLNYKPKYYYLNCPLTDGINLMIGASISF